MSAEQCGYCGRFMGVVDYGAEYGTELVCSRTDWHIAADPAHWTIGSLETAVRVAKIRAGYGPDMLLLPAVFIDHLDEEWHRAFWDRQIERALAGETNEKEKQ